MRYWLFFGLFMLLGLDVVCKKWALAYLPPIQWYADYPFQGIGILQWGGVTFSLNMVTNMGAAWGIFSSYPTALLCVRLAVIGGLSLFLLLYSQNNPFLGLIWVGAIGNVLDYFFYGHVIDFFHWTFWGYSFPVFNVADMCITCGALGLLFFRKSEMASA